MKFSTVLCCCPISLNLAAPQQYQQYSYSVYTDVLIADPLCAGDEKLVLLLPPDSPSPPDYSYSVCVCVYLYMHHLVQLCRQLISLTGCEVCRKGQYSFVFCILYSAILNVVQIVKRPRVWYSMATR